MSPTLTRSQFNSLPKELINKGRIFNADVWLVRHKGDWVIKDFRQKPFFYRWTMGLYTAWFECYVVRYLQGLEGTPEDAFRMDRYAWGCRLIPSEPLRNLDETRCGRSFFQRLESITMAMHSKGIAHLDLRNARNILVDTDNKPHLIDFQSAVFTSRLPRALRRLCEKIDLSGIYKHWLQRDPDSLGAQRERILAWHMRMRILWPWRGYKLPGHRKLYDREKVLKQRVAKARKTDE